MSVPIGDVLGITTTLIVQALRAQSSMAFSVMAFFFHLPLK